MNIDIKMSALHFYLKGSMMLSTSHPEEVVIEVSS